MSYSALLRDTCTIRAMTAAQSAASGGFGSTPSDTTGVPCLIQSSGSSEALARRQMTGREQFMGFFEYGVALTAGSKVIWNSRTLEVRGKPMDPAGMRTHYEVNLEEVEPNA
jgi:hypothetical protein